jgi:prepilin-type N-terminal cleavage/methylation domain-containing protein
MLGYSYGHGPRRGGYTLIELLLVIGILGLAGAILVPHLVDQQSMTAQAAVRKVIADLSFAQSDALAHQEHRRVHFYADGSGYCLYRPPSGSTHGAFDADTADFINDPLAAEDYIVLFSEDDRFDGVVVTDVDIDGSNNDIVYDPLGGTVQASGAPGTGGSLVIENNNDRFEISIAPFTGKLTVARIE